MGPFVELVLDLEDGADRICLPDRRVHKQDSDNLERPGGLKKAALLQATKPHILAGPPIKDAILFNVPSSKRVDSRVRGLPQYPCNCRR
jgi:hypothetical protein